MMRLKRIAAWASAISMVLTMAPEVLFAAPLTDPTPYPSIVTEVFGDITNDHTEVTNGTDLNIIGADYPVDMPAKDASEGEITDPDDTRVKGVGAPSFKYEDDDVKYYRRNKMLTFVAKSNAADADQKKFTDASSSGVQEGAVEIAYMDFEKKPLKLNEDQSFELHSIADDNWDEAWIDVSTDIQRTDVVLDRFMDDAEELTDLNSGLPIDKTKITAAQLFATGDQVSFMIYNIIRGEFSGYIRIKITDNAGNTTFKDYPFIADGQYPEVKLTSSTAKNKVGETTAETYRNTFIASDSFEEPVDKEESTTKISKRYPTLDENQLKAALEAVRDGKKYDNSSYGSYDPYEIWAMDDVTVDTIEISDSEITSGIASVTYKIENNPDTVALSGGTCDPTTESGTITLSASGDYSIAETGDGKIHITKEGLNILTITTEDKAGLVKTNRYYFFIDKTKPEAKYTLNALEENVVQLFSEANTVTNKKQGIDMNGSTDIVSTITDAELISNLAVTDADVEAEAEKVYQYRLLARDYSVAEADIDFGVMDSEQVPKGYTKTAPANTPAEGAGEVKYGEWICWALTDAKAIIDEEFDGLVQVRVQDRAGNWSDVTSAAEDTVIADSTDPVISDNVYRYDLSAEEKSKILGTLPGTPQIVNKTGNANEGFTADWINDSAVLDVTISDKDLANLIRSSGLSDGKITLTTEFNDENETKNVTVWSDGGTDMVISGNTETEITKDYLFTSTDKDKNVHLYVQYDGTGEVTLTLNVKDKADVNDDIDGAKPYKVMLRVDKINPYITYKGYDITDGAASDLLKPNSGAAVDYELRNMPWGPNSQVLEVTVKDDDITPVQSNTADIRFNSDKPLDLYKFNGDEFVKIGEYASGSGNVIELSDCRIVDNTYYEANPGYIFYIVYEGTGIAKIEFYADDKAGNVRDYPSAQAVPVEYDAMLRVDKINPEIKNAKLVQTADDVNDGFMLFSVRETNVDVNTRKQMKLAFEITDENTTAEQSGVNIQNEKITNVDLMDVYSKYVEADKTHLYDNEATVYATDEVNDEAVDPNIDYILLPVEVGEIDGLGGTFTDPASGSNADIEALVNTYIDRYTDTAHPVEWKKASWEDGMIVVPDEFQGAIVLRTIDRVGNVDYSEPITFVAESRDPLIDFKPQSGYIYSQNNYGWSKRDWDYIEIKIKDDNEEKVDAWFENAFIKVTDLEGNDISAASTVEFARTLDEATDTDPSALTYQSLSGYGTVHAEYGYDVIADIIAAGKTIEREARDDKGYIHLGYVRVSQSAQVKVTLFDKAKYNDADYSGNKTTGIWTSRIDRVAPVITAFDLVPVYEGAEKENENNGFALKITAEDALSGMAPDITEADYNVYTPENIPAAGVFAADASYLYKITNDTDVEIERFNSGTFNDGQYEMPGLQYALIPGNGDLEEVAPWNFESDPSTIYDVNGYNGEMGKPYVWHNYVDDKTPMIPEDFDGLIVVRAIDKAGNITVVGYSSILDVEADNDWNNETQYIQVRTDNKWDDGSIVNVQYYGNNNLLFPADMRKDLSNSLNNGEGAVIEIAEEGITNVVITATEEFTAVRTAKAKNDQRNSDWEGDMIIGNASAGGYRDWKFQVVDVKIDKTNPEFAFELIDEADNRITDKAVAGSVTIKLTDIIDPIPNIPDELGYRSHIPSGIAKVEWCAAPEGSSEEAWKAADDWKNGKVGILDADAFTGTIKIRVIDNAGNTVEKSQRIKIDSVDALISISKSYDNEWSKDPVDVFVTVSENAEFSDVKEVKYEVEYEDGSTAEGKLTLTGGTISIDKEGMSNVKITAVTKAGVKATAETKVRIDRTAPTFDLELTDETEAVLADGASTASKVTITAKNVDGTVSTVDKIEWCAVAEGSVNEVWTDITVSKTLDNASAFTGTVKVRVTDKAGNVTVKTQRIKIDPTAALISISKSYDNEWSKDPVDVFVTVSENAEFSDVKEVKYEVEYEDESTAEGNLTLTGGTISIDKEGMTNVKITAVTKAGVKATAETKVRIDRTAPTFDLELTDDETGAVLTDGASTASKVTVKAENVDGTISTADKIEWCAVAQGTVNEAWTDITVSKKADISDSFIGTVKVRVTDKAGNVAVKTQRITVDKGMPVISIDRIEEPFGNVISIPATKEAVVIGITVNKGTCISDVNSLTYKIAKDGAGEAVKYMNPNGGNIVLNDEGTWNVTDIKAVMESGVEYTYPYAIAVTIDRTAPNLSGTEVTAGDDLALFSISSTKKQNLTIKANDVRLKSVEYAVVEKGAEPEWISVSGYTNGTPKTIADVINKAFDGTVMVRATDTVGNVSMWTQNVFTEGIAPEISLTSAGYNGGWISQDAFITVDILDKGVSSQIKEIIYTLTDNNKPDGENNQNGSLSGEFEKNGEVYKNWAKLNSNGGVIVISKEGDYTLEVTATDYAGNSSTQSVNVKIDKTAPTYSGSVGLSLFNVHDIPEGDWNYIHDGWTYNHDVSLEGLTDSLSGIDKVSVTFTGKDGTITKDDVQTSYTFSASGRYDVVITDKAGNVRNISFTIDKNLKYAINVVEVDSVGKLNIAVTDGNERLSFYQKEEGGSSFTKMFNGVTDQLWDGRTGVRKIYAQDDSGNKTNTLYVLVAPTADYGVSLMSLTSDPNRYIDVALDGEEVTVVKNAALFNPALNQAISVNSEVELNEDGIYTITIK